MMNDLTTASSRMNDRVRNPNLKAEDHEKLLSNLSIDGAWELFKSWVREEDGGNQEHVPFGKEVFRRSKPYYVRNEERSVCRCIYHLRCEEFVQVILLLIIIILKLKERSNIISHIIILLIKSKLHSHVVYTSYTQLKKLTTIHVSPLRSGALCVQEKPESQGLLKGDVHEP